MNRTVFILSLCQALLGTGNILLIAMAALIGQSLAPTDALITFPLALQFVGLMSATIPASLIMHKLGRRKGFYLGNALGILGALGCTAALFLHSFVGFCMGSFLLGVGIGFGTLYRFAAIDSCAPEQKSRAISFVMLGGVLAAFLGPALAVESKDWIADYPFTGSFLGVVALNVLAFALLTRAEFPEYMSGSKVQLVARPLLEIISQPIFILSVVAATVGYVVMNLLMSATPLAMHHHGFTFTDSAWVIQWHVLGMFLPSFITPKLIRKFGAVVLTQTGAVLILLCIAVNYDGQSLWHFWAGLVLLGLGWNFMFISATHLVTSAYEPHEKAKTQAANEFILFSMVTVSALSSGWLEATIGWTKMNLLMIVVVVISILVVWFFSRKIPAQAIH
ncbi:MAG: putative drug transport transmembrane protein [Osedax symbiont Rs1]|nr:MAG: putative drug transport transmembrane protein [Osedax symbiont Rs1]